MIRCALVATRAAAVTRPGEWRERLDPALEAVVRTHEDDLAAPPLIARGDDIQLLLSSAAPALDVACLLADALHPLRPRFGVGRGKLAPPLRAVPGSPTGPVLVRAHAAIELTGRGGWSIRFVGFGPYTDTLDVLGDCGLAIVAGWTPAQRESVRSVLEHGTQGAAAAALGRSRSTVTRNLQRALANQYVRIREQVRELLASIPEHVDYIADAG